ncbi:hypothetical protein, partial [Cognatazoarcus halotolerans]|uniref:hypothetical protein n=1 Tax=Cognatazoarcus halotolerans TaxID=2686016 RepID=UPI001357F5AE
MTASTADQTDTAFAALALTVLFVRTAVEGNRWIDHRWEMVGLTLTAGADVAGADHVPRACPPLELHSDESEGYQPGNQIANLQSISNVLMGEIRPNSIRHRSDSLHARARLLEE